MNLLEVARQALLSNGFEPDFSTEIGKEVAAQQPSLLGANDLQDLRGLLWSSIDNDDSRDLDQIEVCERLDQDVLRI
jgi:exoribonuclease-2